MRLALHYFKKDYSEPAVNSFQIQPLKSQFQNNIVSSAYISVFTGLVYRGRSLINNKNIHSPKIGPWGTQFIMNSSSEITLLTHTLCLRLEDMNQTMTKFCLIAYIVLVSLLKYYDTRSNAFFNHDNPNH